MEERQEESRTGSKKPRGISRRGAMRLLAGMAATGPLISGHGGPGVALAADVKWPFNREKFDRPPALPKEDDLFLDELERRGCLFFVEQADAATGQVMDRSLAANKEGTLDPGNLSSIAATGFGLSSLCIADQRGYFPKEKILQQVRTTLQFYMEKLPHEHGFFWHFNDGRTGTPSRWSEVSSIDTALFLCGALTARAHFKDPAITDLATRIYNRVDWPWMLNGGQTFSMGWHEKTGFITTRWDKYCELMMLYLLAIGSTTHPVGPEFWGHFARPMMKYDNFEYVGSPDPLFVHQYSHAYFDFRNKRDEYANYFDNSRSATLAHRSWCLSLNKGYSDEYWGVTASDSKTGYRAWGGPPMMGPVDGTVVPCASAGSLPFAPAECLRVLRALKENYGERVWGRYGLCDAFQRAERWYGRDVLGIDLGIGVLMAENLRTGFIWETFMRNPEPVDAMKKCGFKRV